MRTADEPEDERPEQTQAEREDFATLRAIIHHYGARWGGLDYEKALCALNHLESRAKRHAGW